MKCEHFLMPYRGSLVVTFLSVAVVACGSEESVSGGAPVDGGWVVDAGGGQPTPDADVSPAVDYPFLFDTTRVIDVHFSFEPSDWANLEVTPDAYVPATIDFDGEVVAMVGVRNKGNISLQFGGTKKSFKVKFSEYEPGKRFYGIKRLNFHSGFKDPTIMRENLAYPMVQAAGAYAPRTSHAKLYVTVPGLFDREYWGLYTNTEQVDKTFLKDRFADPEGTLYKGARFHNWFGPDPSNYVPSPFVPKTNELGDHTRLVEFLDVLNNGPDNSFEADIQEIFEVDSFLSWLAVNTLLSNMDNVSNGGGTNGYLYHDPASNKMVYIAWDMNEAFGSTSEGLSIDELIQLDIFMPVVNPAAPSPIIGRILGVPAFQASYLQKLQALVDGSFSAAAMNNRVDELYALTRDHALADTRKHYNAVQYEASLTQDVISLPNPPYPSGNMVIGLRRFIDARITSVAGQLSN